MTKIWSPSWLGQRVTRSADWHLQLEADVLVLRVGSQDYRVPLQARSPCHVHRGWLWTDLLVETALGTTLRLDGLPNAAGRTLSAALDQVLAELQHQAALAELLAAQHAVERWLAEKSAMEQSCLQTRRWLTHEAQRAMLERLPAAAADQLRTLSTQPPLANAPEVDLAAIRQSLAALAADHRRAWAAQNEAHTQRELHDCAELFATVERQPLTDEQARAAVCFDNRVQLIAAAGSGKTSTIIAKAVYAVSRQLVAPSRIVLLAFNKQAADELAERAAQALARVGLADVSIETSTFHALGLRIIGQATRAKPDIPDWAINAKDGTEKIAEIVDQLKDRSLAFRLQWDLFRFVFGRDLSTFGQADTPDVWDAQGDGLLLTCRGERVKSQEEAMIANYLFLNGVDYLYESPYLHRTVTADRRQYKPDFFYPDIGLYHEHFALDANGNPPAHFKDYSEGVAWKRRLHREMATTLFETTSHGLRHGDDLQRLGETLSAHGLTLNPNPDREIPREGKKPMEAVELIQLLRTFISHAKSNSLSVDALQAHVAQLPADAFRMRYQRFVDIAVPVMQAWDAALAQAGGIDFEDMLNLAAEHLERGDTIAPYELVMADEFQDASRARARLCRALVQPRGRYFFAVGDDWQAINRFAGADLSVMTGFEQWFGSSQQLKLERTFRCPQDLCDLSSAFVSKNPAQIAKTVRSLTPSQGPVLKAFQVSHMHELPEAIEKFLLALATQVRDGTVAPGRNGKVSVYILGRYNADRQYLPSRPGRFSPWLEIAFLTTHRAKGSEADYVILPEMISNPRRRSFPSTRSDDPVLSLVMPNGDSYPLSEERRLFYVALTRARRSVALFTVRGQRSVFLDELRREQGLAIQTLSGDDIAEARCPACQQGVLITRQGPYGEFHACSNYPTCEFKPKAQHLRPEPAPRPPAARPTAPAAPAPTTDTVIPAAPGLEPQTAPLHQAPPMPARPSPAAPPQAPVAPTPRVHSVNTMPPPAPVTQTPPKHQATPVPMRPSPVTPPRPAATLTTPVHSANTAPPPTPAPLTQTSPVHQAPPVPVRPSPAKPATLTIPVHSVDTTPTPVPAPVTQAPPVHQAPPVRPSPATPPHAPVAPVIGLPPAAASTPATPPVAPAPQPAGSGLPAAALSPFRASAAPTAPRSSPSAPTVPSAPSVAAPGHVSPAATPSSASPFLRQPPIERPAAAPPTSSSPFGARQPAAPTAEAPVQTRYATMDTETLSGLTTGGDPAAFAETITRAERGDGLAQNDLGFCYGTGVNVEKNYRAAHQWYGKAAEQGVLNALFNLGCLHHQGLGCKRDYNQAEHWFSLAAAGGHAKAQQNLAALAIARPLVLQTYAAHQALGIQKAPGLPDAALARMYLKKLLERLSDAQVRTNFVAAATHGRIGLENQETVQDAVMWAWNLSSASDLTYLQIITAARTNTLPELASHLPPAT